MNTDCSILRNLVDALEDGYEFYDDAAQRASDGSRRLYQEKARHYAAMLADLRDWIARGNGPGEDDGFTSLLDLINVAVRDAPRELKQDTAMAA